MPKRIRTYVNYGPTWGNVSFTEAGVDPFFMQRGGGFELGWTEDWLGYGASPEHVSDQLALLRAAGAPSAQELGVYVVAVDGPAQLQRIRLYEALAGGARHINSYNYGPYYASIDSWGARFEVYRFISDALHDFAAVDAALAGAKRHKSDVAVVYNRSAAIWSGADSTTEQDARYLFWALSHAGYQPDFISEEDIETGGLNGYKALYLTGMQLRRRSANAIASWVARGGHVFATAGAGSRDEYNQPSTGLDRTFGARSVAATVVSGAGRPKYELRRLGSLGKIQSVSGVRLPDVGFDQLCVQERIEPLAGAQIALRNALGAPAGVLMRGRGTALRVAALPGIAYLHEAISAPGYDVESYHPTAFRPALRDFITWTAQLGHAYHIESNAPSVESVRYDRADRAVVILVNHGAPLEKLELRIPEMRGLVAHSASGAQVKVSRLSTTEAMVSLPLEAADAVILER